MFRFTNVLLLIAVASAGKIVLKDCKDGAIGNDIVLEVDGFPDGTTKVTLVKGEDYNFKISFTAASSSSTLKNKLFGEIIGIEVPWNGVEPDACKGFPPTQGCPITSGASYTYQNKLHIEKSYPSVSLNIIWKLIDSDGKNQVCFKLPAKIQS